MLRRPTPVLILMAFALLFPTVAAAASLMIGPADLVPSSSSNHNYVRGDNFQNNDNVFGFAWYAAPVHLPDGAIIRRVVIVYYDNGSESINFYLHRINFTSDGKKNICGFTTSGAEPEYRTQVIEAGDMLYRFVNNQKYAYQVAICFNGAGSDYLFRGLRIDYALPQ